VRHLLVARLGAGRVEGAHEAVAGVADGEGSASVLGVMRTTMSVYHT
jgi:hypothetical protein